MITYHIHIKGLVQGVGFRPHVYRIAQSMGVKGWVNNSGNGVHIIASADEETLNKFYRKVLQKAPHNAVITEHHAALIATQQFNDFYIQNSEGTKRPDLLITPDFGMCAHCREELFDTKNRRYHYPFITCTQCGPRYSIITGLPYDRDKTAMSDYAQCWECKNEYHDPENRRYYSQTNSCIECGIPMRLYNKDGDCICTDYECILLMVQEALVKGHIVAVKGIGGYLLLCDATNYLAISTLRERKQRPAKPLALLYASLASIEDDVYLQDVEREALTGVVAPIVLCNLKQHPASGLCTEIIAPGLYKVGIMLPYAPLLALIASNFKKPLVATSGNVSGAPIFYKDEDALNGLGSIADLFLAYDREIMVPQDDSVVQFSKVGQQQIILRRSRGMAPDYFGAPFSKDLSALAIGAELKSSFALLENNLCYVSQYLGDQSAYESQQSYSQTLRHLTGLLKFEPEVILVDKHPGYFVTHAGKELANKHKLPLFEVQHHKAHFAAVLAENDLLETPEPVLGVIWDGTGYGDDRQIWGGEFFIYEEGNCERKAHLDYFPLLSGDKMAKEPRLSSLSLLNELNAVDAVSEKFSDVEWTYFSQLLNKYRGLQTCSMGRFLDGIASLLTGCDKAAYESEAAMKLEAMALQVNLENDTPEPYPVGIEGEIIRWQSLLQSLLADLKAGVSKQMIAYKVHLSLIEVIRQMAILNSINHIAFSGGVWQNSLLVELAHSLLKDYQLYFHKQLSPNDECISFGQLAYFHITEKLTVATQNLVALPT